MDQVKTTEPDASFEWVSLDIKEYYENMTHQVAADDIQTSFGKIRADGEFFAMDKS